MNWTARTCNNKIKIVSPKMKLNEPTQNVFTLLENKTLITIKQLSPQRCQQNNFKWISIFITIKSKTKINNQSVSKDKRNLTVLNLLPRAMNSISMIDFFYNIYNYKIRNTILVLLRITKCFTTLWRTYFLSVLPFVTTVMDFTPEVSLVEESGVDTALTVPRATIFGTAEVAERGFSISLMS